MKFCFYCITAFLTSQTEAFTTTRVSNSLSLLGSNRRRYKTCTLYGSKGPKDEYLYDNEDGLESGYYGTKYVDNSKSEIDIQEIAYDNDNENAYNYYDDDYGDVKETPPRRNGNNKMQRYRDYEDYDDDQYDDYNDDDSGPIAGNYWSNSNGKKAGSTSVSRRNGERDYYRRNPYDDRGRPGKRTTFRSGRPTVPRPAKDFYDRLFWYGFDPSETTDVGDKTVFGGTKGKFNGLAYLNASERPSRNGRRLPPSRRDYVDDDDYFYDDDDEAYADEDIDDNYYNQASRAAGRGLKPPNDLPIPRSEKIDPADRRAARRRSRQRRMDDSFGDDYGYNDNRANNWVSKQVSSWFIGEDEDDDEDYDDRSRRRQRRRQSSEWSPFNVLDTFLGVDRDELEYKAGMYNQNMGIGRRRRGSPREKPRRPGYAYRYVDTDDDDSLPVADFDTIVDAIENDKPTRQTPYNSPKEEEEPKREKKERSWEERAMAVERVPPADIVAWGPSGELSIDARTKGIMDALEDIQTAEQKLLSRKKKESLAREEITILKVDAELQRRRLEQSGRKGVSLAQERLRQIELDIDDASRVLRRARTQVEIAWNELEELKDRHWALLSFYNPDQAEQKVSEALYEFQQLEPAARLEDANMPNESASPVDSAQAGASTSSVNLDANSVNVSSDASDQS